MSHLHLVALVVREYRPAIEFFVDLLGFDLVEDVPSRTNDGRPKRWVVVRPPGGQTGVLLARADGAAQSDGVGDQFAGRVGLFLRVDDFAATHRRMVAANVEFVSAPRSEPYGMVAVFLDPERNRWDLLGPIPEAPDRLRIVILIGASGAGKTAVAELLSKREPWAGHTHHFDSIGVTGPEEMERAGGGEVWQKRATGEWIDTLAQTGGDVQLLEGQTRPSFLEAALSRHPQLCATIILLDCTPEVRGHRLEALRGQPELANADMDRWATYLRGQADALELPVIDTSDLSLEEVAGRVEDAAGMNREGDHHDN